MSQQILCPQCQCEDVYQDGNLWVCPLCSHEWNPEEGQGEAAVPAEAVDGDGPVRDAFGHILQNGDSVTVIKDLKLKGGSGTVKGGTKVKNIRLSDAGDGHNISCKIEGLGALNLKSEFVKKI